MLSMNRIEVLLKENMKHIKTYGIMRLGIFGSFSKGCPTENSDIDMLITFKPDMKNFDNYMELKFFLEELLGRNIDLVIEENIKADLREEILRSVYYVEAA